MEAPYILECIQPYVAIDVWFFTYIIFILTVIVAQSERSQNAN